MSAWRRRAGEGPGEAARRLIARITAHGTPRREARGQDLITSVNSERAARQSLKGYLVWCRTQQIPRAEQDHRAHLVRYLAERARLMRQKTLDCDRRSLGLAFHVRLPQFTAERRTEPTSRSYQLAEVQRIAARQSERNRLATWLSFHSGVRAHELATIVRREERAPSGHRAWRADRFVGLSDYLVYVVVGKGGLIREVAVPRALAEWLERRRRGDPVRVRDREIYYLSHYDIGFGAALSQSFTTASQQALGWSNGFHGLRHSYAKRRLAVMLDCGHAPVDALRILAQELGHFRVDITFHYLR